MNPRPYPHGGSLRRVFRGRRRFFHGRGGMISSMLTTDMSIEAKSPLNRPRNFCILPWVNASIDVNGSFRPCCKFAQPAEPGAPNLGNLRSSSLEEIWNGAALQALRQEFLEGRRPSACHSCWNEEDSGVVSYRQEFARHRLAHPETLRFTSVEASPPLALDLKLSQKCNLKCRICGPIASSTFMDEERANNPDLHISDDDVKYLSAYKLIGDEVQIKMVLRR